jgi:glycerophosphoryl diester phosphodiesterase
MPIPKIIAHRGVWKNSGLPQNSIAALKKSKELGCDGCELDVHLTADGVVVVNHDHDFYGTPIEESTHNELCATKHPNGEMIPTLEEFLAKATIPLFLEIKASMISIERSLELTQLTVATVNKSTFNQPVHYISFSEEVLSEVLLENVSATVSLLNGTLKPSQIKSRGWHGLDYYVEVFRKNPQWMAEAHKLGLLTNVWTVNDAENMHWFLEAGVDFISTDEPEILIHQKKYNNAAK